MSFYPPFHARVYELALYVRVPVKYAYCVLIICLVRVSPALRDITFIFFLFCFAFNRLSYTSYNLLLIIVSHSVRRSA